MCPCNVGGGVKSWLKIVTGEPFPILANQNTIGGKWIVWLVRSPVQYIRPRRNKFYWGQSKSAVLSLNNILTDWNICKDSIHTGFYLLICQRETIGVCRKSSLQNHCRCVAPGIMLMDGLSPQLIVVLWLIWTKSFIYMINSYISSNHLSFAVLLIWGCCYIIWHLYTVLRFSFPSYCRHDITSSFQVGVK